MSNEPMLAWLEEASMNPESLPESPAVRAWREELEARGEARGEARALLAVLAARGLPVDEDTRVAILATTDLDALERWIQRSVTAASLDEVFAGG